MLDFSQSDTLPIEIPRDPDVVDTLEYYRAEEFHLIAPNTGDTLISSWYASAATNLSTGEFYRFAFSQISSRFNGDANDSLGRDTTYYGYIDHSPTSYDIISGPPGWPKYGYFIQYVDSIYHPVLSTNESLKAEQLSVFPMPAHTQLTIPTESIKDGQYRLAIHNGLGQAFVRKENLYLSPAQDHSVDLSQLPAGSYWITLASRSTPLRYYTAYFVKLAGG